MFKETNHESTPRIEYVREILEPIRMIVPDDNIIITTYQIKVYHDAEVVLQWIMNNPVPVEKIIIDGPNDVYFESWSAIGPKTLKELKERYPRIRFEP